MPYTITERDDVGSHHWCVATANCRLTDADDALIKSTVALVRRSYGEDEILADVADVLGSEIAKGSFKTEHLLAAIRGGPPNPAAEGDKKPWLTTYRSQSAELVAKAALAKAYAVE